MGAAYASARVTNAGSRNSKSAPRFFDLSHLRGLRGAEQVAAVCYRIRNARVEFLLVQTRAARRWTFPKGSVMPGLSHAQAAALEAFEEGGVHGRMAERPFAHYTRRKRIDGKGSPEIEIVVRAHLCEVTYLEEPPEAGRNPAWFSPEKAKRRLQEERRSEHGSELVRILDAAVVRIQRSRTN